MEKSIDNLLGLINKNPNLPIIILINNNFINYYEPDTDYTYGSIKESFVAEYCDYTFNCSLPAKGSDEPEHFCFTNRIFRSEIHIIEDHLLSECSSKEPLEQEVYLRKNLDKIFWKTAIFVCVSPGTSW